MWQSFLMGAVVGAVLSRYCPVVARKIRGNDFSLVDRVRGMEGLTKGRRPGDEPVGCRQAGDDVI